MTDIDTFKSRLSASLVFLGGEARKEEIVKITRGRNSRLLSIIERMVVEREMISIGRGVKGDPIILTLPKKYLSTKELETSEKAAWKIRF